MKKLILSFLMLAAVGVAFSQVLLEQDFQGYANGGTIDFQGEPDDAEAEDWIAFDQDGLPEADAGGGALTGNWFGSVDLKYAYEEYTADTNFVMGSTSYLVGFAPGNRNWLITPEVEIPATGEYHFMWKASLQQTPRYADGHSIWISPDGSASDVETDFTDQLWIKAQMVEETGWLADYYGMIDYSGCTAPTGQDSAVIEAVCWFPETYGDGTNGTGYRHAMNHTNMDYLPLDTGYTASFRGALEPHSLNLSAYAGQTIRIAIVHDSDDDFVMAVDDIMVASPVVGLNDFDFEDIAQFYPNPAADFINVRFTSIVQESAVLNVFDLSGKLVMSETINGNSLYTNNVIDVASLSSGLYNMQVVLDNNGIFNKKFMKK